MSREFFRQALHTGRIEEQDLQAASADLAGKGCTPISPAAVRLAIAVDADVPDRPSGKVATVAEILDAMACAKPVGRRTAFMTDEISRWCAAFFDQGQAFWPLPSRDLGLYASWRESMRHDHNAEMMGVRGFRTVVAALPEDPMRAIAMIVTALGIPQRAVEDYLHRALLDIGGWAAYGRGAVEAGGFMALISAPLRELGLFGRELGERADLCELHVVHLLEAVTA